MSWYVTKTYFPCIKISVTNLKTFHTTQIFRNVKRGSGRVRYGPYADFGKHVTSRPPDYSVIVGVGLHAEPASYYLDQCVCAKLILGRSSWCKGLPKLPNYGGNGACAWASTKGMRIKLFCAIIIPTNPSKSIKLLQYVFRF